MPLLLLCETGAILIVLVGITTGRQYSRQAVQQYHIQYGMTGSQNGRQYGTAGRQYGMAGRQYGKQYGTAGSMAGRQYGSTVIRQYGKQADF